MASPTAYVSGSLTQVSSQSSFPSPDILPECFRNKYKQLIKAEKVRKALTAELDSIYKRQYAAICNQQNNLKLQQLGDGSKLASLDSIYSRQQDAVFHQRRKLQDLSKVETNLQILYFELSDLKATHSKEITTNGEFSLTEAKISQYASNIADKFADKCWVQHRLLQYSDMFVEIQDEVVDAFNQAQDADEDVEELLAYYADFETIQDEIVEKFSAVKSNGEKVEVLRQEFLTTIDNLLHQVHVVVTPGAPAIKHHNRQQQLKQSLQVIPSQESLLRPANPSLRRTPSLRKIPSSIRSVTPKPVLGNHSEDSSSDGHSSGSDTGNESDGTAPTDPDIDAVPTPVVVVDKPKPVDLSSFQIDDEARHRIMKRFNSSPDLRRGEVDEDTGRVRFDCPPPNAFKAKQPTVVEEEEGEPFDYENMSPPCDSDDEE